MPLRKKRWLAKRSLKTTAPVVLVVGILLFTALELTNAIDFINKSEPADSSSANAENIPNTNDSTESSTPVPSGSNENGAGSSNESEGAPKSAAQPSSGQPPKSPDQSTYVSNHEPNSKADMLQSVCVTSPGAVCTISFSRNGLIRSLPSTTADSYGSVYWTWSPQERGLSSGSWVISAKASLNGKTTSSQDVINLQVP